MPHRFTRESRRLSWSLAIVAFTAFACTTEVPVVPGIPAPAAPAGLTVTPVSPTAIGLAWTDHADNEDGFRVERCTGANCTAFTEITTLPAGAISYANTGLNSATSYSYRVRAFNAGGTSSYTESVSATTPATPPAAPAGLAATAASASQIDLTWIDNASNEDGFRIERCSGASCSTFSEIATVGAGVTSYSNTGLTASTTYSYRVRAHNSAGTSSYSSTASATTPTTPPASPAGLAANTVSASRIDLSWTDNASNEDGFRIERCSGASCTTFAEIATAAANVTTYSSTGLSASTGYSYRVRAYNPAGNSAYTATASATTSAAPSAPAAPSNLAATAAAATQIDLTWTDNATNEDGFRIERCAGASCTTFAEIAAVAAGVVAYSNTGLSASTAYRYRVRAHNGVGNSVYSVTATATTLAIPVTLPGAPTSLTATAASATQLDLTWTDNATNEDGFRIERCTGAACSTFTEIATVAAGVTSYANTGLLESTSYGYRVRAHNTAGNSAYSDVATASTPATVPAAPTSLTASATSATQIDIAWIDNASNETGFRIERCSGAGCSNFSEVATVAAGVISYSSTGLSAVTVYRFRVRAYNSAGNSAYSAIAGTTTLDTPPSAPTGLIATPVSATQIDLWWTDNSGNEDGFRIERCSGAGCSSFTEIATVGGGVTGYSSTGLGAATVYGYRIRAYNIAGSSTYSATAVATTYPVGPTVTTDFATGISETGLTMNGTVNPNASASSAFFEWSYSATFSPLFTTNSVGVGSGTSAVPISQPITSNLCGLPVYYRAAATNSGGVTVRGSELFASLGSCTIPITPGATGPGTTSAPGPLLESTTLTMSWSAVSNAANYIVTVLDITTNTLVVSVAPSTPSYSVTLTAGRQYKWDVAACNPAGCSPASAALYVRTP